MKENSIKEDIKLLREMKNNCLNGFEYYTDPKAREKAEAIEHILSDYKRVLKENEILKYKYNKALSDVIARVDLDNTYISKQKVKDKIEEYKNMLKTCNKAQDVDRIKAINERVLELQELLESEEN